MHIGSQHIKWVCGISHSVCSNLKVSEGLGIRQAHGACPKAASWGRFQLLRLWLLLQRKVHIQNMVVNCPPILEIRITQRLHLEKGMIT